MRRTLLPLVAMAFLALAACGDDGGGAKGKASGADAPVGSWTMDRERTVASGVAAAKKGGAGAHLTDAQIREQVEKNVAGGTFDATFKADKTFTVTMKGLSDDATATGTWTRDGDKVVMRLESKNGKPAEGADKEDPANLSIRGDRMVVLSPAGDELFWLKRP